MRRSYSGYSRPAQEPDLASIPSCSIKEFHDLISNEVPGRSEMERDRNLICAAFLLNNMDKREFAEAIRFFSRLRRAEIGIHHHVAGDYLQAYATEMAWREDVRRQSNGNQFAMLVSAVAAASKSAQWCGYWQRKAV